MGVDMGMRAKRTSHGVAEVRTIGDREYVVRADERLLAKKGRWELSEFMNWRSEAWVSLKLFDTHSQARKRIYQLGYSLKNQRMAVNVHSCGLRDRYPEVVDWVLGTMRELHGSGELELPVDRKEPAQ